LVELIGESVKWLPFLFGREVIMEEIERIEYRGFDIVVYPDDCCFGKGPRDWDNFGKMICFHPRYDLGDEHDLTVEQVEEMVERKDVHFLWLFLLDHSGLWMRTGRFECDAQGWDTSRVGIIYCTDEMIKAEYGKVGKVEIKKAFDLMESEVQTYSWYLEGSVYGYVVEAHENNRIEFDDSCWGFYGYGKDSSWDYMISEAKSSIDYAIKEYRKETVKMVKFLRGCWAV
jgi:hypothetical protein